MFSKVVSAACLCSLQGCTGDTAVSQRAPAPEAPAATSTAIASTLDGIKEKYKLNAIILSAEQDGKPLARTALGVYPGQNWECSHTDFVVPIHAEVATMRGAMGETTRSTIRCCVGSTSQGFRNFLQVR